MEYVRQSKTNILCQRVECFIQAILKSADIRAIVKGVEVDYSVIIKVFGSSISFLKMQDDYDNQKLTKYKRALGAFYAIMYLFNLKLNHQVLPTDDSSRYRVKHKFRQLLKFSKEVRI